MESAARIQSSRTEPVSSSGGSRELRLLLTSAGRRVELLQCFRAAASDLGLQLTIFGCDLDPQLSAACRLADQAWAVPRADDPDYADEVLAICSREGVSLLVPTIDPELAPLSVAEPRFAGMGVELAVGSPASCHAREISGNSPLSAAMASPRHVPRRSTGRPLPRKTWDSR